ncbi:hypothetical protein L7F22_059535 [Adiantum nelumboides]|nr:hypothetical protein [Adiantum nelumboides]
MVLRIMQDQERHAIAVAEKRVRGFPCSYCSTVEELGQQEGAEDQLPAYVNTTLTGCGSLISFSPARKRVFTSAAHHHFLHPCYAAASPSRKQQLFLRQGAGALSFHHHPYNFSHQYYYGSSLQPSFNPSDLLYPDSEGACTSLSSELALRGV